MPYSEPILSGGPSWEIQFSFEFKLPGQEDNQYNFGGVFSLPAAVDIFGAPAPAQVTDALLQNLIDYFSKMGPLNGVEEISRSISGQKIQGSYQIVEATPVEQQLPLEE